MDGTGPNRRKKAAFSNFSSPFRDGLVWTVLGLTVEGGCVFKFLLSFS